MKNILVSLALLFASFELVQGQTDPRDALYTPPVSTAIAGNTETKNKSSFYNEFDFLIKFHAGELLRNQLLFSFEKSLGDNSSLDLTLGHSLGNRMFGATSGIGLGIIEEFVAEFSEVNVLPSVLLTYGEFNQKFRPVVGLSLKFFTDADRFDNSLQTAQFFYQYSSAGFTMPTNYSRESQTFFRPGNEQTNIISNHIGIRYGYQFLHFKKPKLSNEIGLQFGLNIISIDAFERQYYQHPDGYLILEYFKTGKRENVNYPTVRLYYNIGFGK